MLAGAVSVEVSCMRQASQITDRFSAEWLAGYRAALSDLEGVLASLGGDALTPFVQARLKAQLMQREGSRRAA